MQQIFTESLASQTGRLAGQDCQYHSTVYYNSIKANNVNLFAVATTLLFLLYSHFLITTIITLYYQINDQQILILFVSTLTVLSGYTKLPTMYAYTACGLTLDHSTACQ